MPVKQMFECDRCGYEREASKSTRKFYTITMLVYEGNYGHSKEGHWTRGVPQRKTFWCDQCFDTLGGQKLVSKPEDPDPRASSQTIEDTIREIVLETVREEQNRRG